MNLYSTVIPYIIAALVIVTFLGIIVQKIWHRLRQPELIGMDAEKIAETWEEIQKTADSGLMGCKMAVIESDKLLDLALKSMMMPGETLGERLKVAAYKYPNIRKVWPAHKLRNNLVHDASFPIGEGQLRGALRDFEAALKLLNVL